MKEIGIRRHVVCFSGGRERHAYMAGSADEEAGFRSVPLERLAGN